MRRRALAGILSTAVVVLGAVGVLVTRAVSAGAPPDLGPGVVVPAGAATPAPSKPVQSGAPVVPVSPRDAGDHDDADDVTTPTPAPTPKSAPVPTRSQTGDDDADDVGESDDGDD